MSGRGELRTSEGIQKLSAGDIALFEKGESGAHQIFNPYQELLVYLDVRSLNRLDVCEYPDTGKVNILPQKDIFMRGESREYFEGEEAVQEVWKKLEH